MKSFRALTGLVAVMINGLFVCGQDSMNALKQTIPFIDSVYRAFAEEQHSPGLAYAVIYQGQVVHMGTYGYTDLEQQIPVSEQSVFRIASMTKSFVAMAILQLRDEGRLKLDDSLATFIPEFAAQPMLTTDAPAVTIRHLLNHTSGLPQDDPWGDRLLDMPQDAFRDRIREGFSFSNTPGVTYEYSNTAFALLGEVIHRITGQPFDAYISQHIWKPLGMNHTYWDYTRVPDGSLAYGYRWVNGAWVKQPLVGHGTYGAMGGMLTTIGDFVKYMALHLQAWPARNGEDSQPIRRSSLREMQSPWVFYSLTEMNERPLSLAYGYGLRWSRDTSGVTTVGHTGGLPGFGSNWIVLPDHDLGVVCFSNITYAPAVRANNLVATSIIERANLAPRAIPVSPILSERQQQLMAFLPGWEHAEESPIFSGNFFADFYIETLRDECKAIFEAAGRIIRVREITPRNKLRGTFVIECENRNVEVFFTLTPEHTPRIQDYAIKLSSVMNGV
ncbi:serine hydrolase domain-containing protein [Parapedobacter pyrenivorans]|uniref:serine hydrolase domain-containing protein n=1 Tax=Parapedobacter pyrenivorans TaxID=1305674 RepID=UPI003341E8C3